MKKDVEVTLAVASELVLVQALVLLAVASAVASVQVLVLYKARMRTKLKTQTLHLNRRGETGGSPGLSPQNQDAPRA